MKIRSRLWATIWISTGCLALAALSALTVLRASGQATPDLPRNVELTNAAWVAFGAKSYDAAIAAADRCVKRFKDEADREEPKLEGSHAPLLPTGKVTKGEKKAIYDQGVLNDVATCY